ncbi:Piwi domain-containing protein [Earliella scabrosa]|nr:Piwi domain-containing protein [Earliella scabrosa]
MNVDVSGAVVRTLQVYTNSFEITRLPTAVYHQYDDINPPSLAIARNYEIIDRLQNDNASVFMPRPLYDGRKNLFSIREIRDNAFEICMRRDRSRPTHRITLTRRLSSLVRRLTTRSNADIGQNAMPLTLIQLLVRQVPNMRHRFPAHARSFYVAETARELGMGLAAWRGFFQSVRPAMDRLLINIDVSWAAVHIPGTLTYNMRNFLKLRNDRDLQSLDRRQFMSLRAFLKGVLVKVTVAPNMRPKPIADLVWEAGKQEFDKDGERYTVERHFQEKYNVRITMPRAVGVRLGRSSVVPAELCDVVPGQVYRKRLDPSLQKKFLSYATETPSRRRDMIQGAVRDNTFNYDDSDFIKDAGMVVNPDMVSVSGVVLKPPKIVYGGNDRPMELNTNEGAWNVQRKRFFRPGERLEKWAVVDFHQARRPHVDRFVDMLVTNMRRLVVNSPHIQSGNGQNAAQSLMEAGMTAVQQLPGSMSRPQLILVLLPENAPELRREVKRWGDTERHVPIQCVRSGKWERANDQYCNNVALKVNARLGGINSIIDSPVSPILQASMVVGADVSHPGPGVTHQPSVTGLVASVDPYMGEFTSFSCVQQPRLETIQDLETMMENALRDYITYKQAQGQPPVPPACVIFYRDGVSEGEFAHVARTEIPMIKRAFRNMGWTNERIQPKLLFIVVGKRHHVRFFPRNPPQDADGSGNCPTGLVVDHQITSPRLQEFYLQSHAGLLGTSRPGHYTILSNEPGFDLRVVQVITYHLCHIYVPATRAVSIPAPLLCSRLDIHCPNGAPVNDTTEQGECDLERWKAVFRPSGLNKRMSYI